MPSEALKELLCELSRRNTDSVAELVFRDHSLFDPLFKLFLRNEEPASRRAAWVVDTVTEKEPGLLRNRTDHIVEALSTFNHDGLKRHALRMLSRSSFPNEEKLGILISVCFDWLLSPAESIAVKVHAMDILYRASQLEPALKKELADSIEWRIGEGSPGFKNHGEKVLKNLYREMDAGDTVFTGGRRG